MRVFGRRSIWQAGFTLVELLVALVLLAVGVLGLSAASLCAASRLGIARLDTRIRVRAQTELESLLAAGDTELWSPGHGDDRLTLAWQVSEGHPRILTVVVAGRQRTEVLADTLVTLERIW
ncbi:MAG TPA: prepilin-type N-terminal cleavage/methylation domain-containing protein [Gemmatimonadota bacterium]|nr:prepilin-type N-terminal cleavage/methylation domain-containing protein [Gemmatimonadota bacterium]